MSATQPAQSPSRDDTQASTPAQAPAPAPADATSMPSASHQPEDSEMKTHDPSTTTTNPAPPMSKNALKRARKNQEWEDGREERRLRRRDRRRAQKDRLRTHRAELLASGADPAAVFAQKKPAVLVPVALVLDCDFEQYMNDKERVSLSSQVTRSYSSSRNAVYRSHLYLSGWKGGIRERFRDVLKDQQVNWKGIGFEEGDFLDASVKARERMRVKPGEMIPHLQASLDTRPTWTRDAYDPFPLPDPEPALDEAYSDVVYLTSDSPYTLTHLEPHTTYIVGGLVDKNREKGLCYRRARERGIRTARLPIGDFMVMQSRQVLATNHVVEIMLKWLECGDWGEAFLSVIPKRKGGKLRHGQGKAEDEGQYEQGEEEYEQDDYEDYEGESEEGEAGGENEVSAKDAAPVERAVTDATPATKAETEVPATSS